MLFVYKIFCLLTKNNMFYIIGINKERSVFTLDKYRIIEVKQSVFEENRN